MRRVLVLCLLAFLGPAVVASAQDADTLPIRPALLVIDIQNQYIPMMDQSEEPGAMRMINGAIWLFRKYERPVIRVYHTSPEWGPTPDSEEFQFPESVIIKESDPQIIKNHPSAFAATNLDALLKEMEVNTLFLCGLSATGCVLATYFGAMEREYGVFMIEQALMSPKARHTEAIQEIASAVDYTALETILKAAAR